MQTQKAVAVQPRIIEVDTLFIGGGPATLGVLSNAYQTQRLDELVLGPSLIGKKLQEGND